MVWRAPSGRAAGKVTIAADLFPYDPNHQTFINVYEGGELVRQDILNSGRTSVDLYSGSRQGLFAVFKAFTASGVHHIAIGPDHILFIIGLLLLGGSLRRLLTIVTAFTIGHSITLALATLQIVDPPARIIEPAIALSIVFVGADNLLAAARAATSGRGWRSRSASCTASALRASCARPGCPSARSACRSSPSISASRSDKRSSFVIVASALALVRKRDAGSPSGLRWSGPSAL